MKLNVKKIEKELKRLGWDYKQLAKEMNVKRTYIYAYLGKYESNPTLKTVTRFAKAISCEPKDLLTN